MANISNGFTGQLYFRVYLVRNKMKVVRLVFIMRNKLLSIGLLILGFNLLCSHSYAGTSGGIYDMSIFLNEPHPFVKGQKPNSIIDNSIIRNAPKIGSLTDLETSAPIMGKIGLKNHALEVEGDQKKVLKNSRIYRAKSIDRKHNKVRLNSVQSLKKSNNLVSEIRIGALWHDQGPFSHRKERGYDGNLELLFSSPEFLRKVWTPRPHIGASINSAGDTNQIYLGLTWEKRFYQSYFANFSLGAGYHDGYKVTDLLDRKSLGCKFLFRESLDVGFRFQNNHSIMAHLDHISNAKLCSTNEGLESVGFRYGYSF